MLNETKGNMYSFVTHTWNPIKGKCFHDCVYCYMKRFPQNPIRLDTEDLKTNLGKDNFIFVGSSTDMFAPDVPITWIEKVFRYCRSYPENKYLFQSKNPQRMYGLRQHFPKNVVVGTTIESNRQYKISKAPVVLERARVMGRFKLAGYATMVTIEPILDFDRELVQLITMCRPDWVNIGADSCGHKLLEPSKDKIVELIEELEKVTDVKIKTNLRRLLR